MNIGEHYRVIEVDTRSSDYSSYGNVSGVRYMRW